MVTQGNSEISPQNAVLLLENIFVRERFDWQAWDLRQMRQSVELMKKVAKRAAWPHSEKLASTALENSLDELLNIIDTKDATRVIAGHTHVEQALSDLRAATFGLD